MKAFLSNFSCSIFHQFSFFEEKKNCLKKLSDFSRSFNFKASEFWIMLKLCATWWKQESWRNISTLKYLAVQFSLIYSRGIIYDELYQHAELSEKRIICNLIEMSFLSEENCQITLAPQSKKGMRTKYFTWIFLNS